MMFILHSILSLLERHAMPCSYVLELAPFSLLTSQDAMRNKIPIIVSARPRRNGIKYAQRDEEEQPPAGQGIDVFRRTRL
jgi:hypothetical protein